MCWNPTCMTGEVHEKRPPKPGFGGHLFFDCYTSCPTPATCQYCDGGIAFCVVCKEGEAGLAKTCPGPKD